MDRSEWQKCFSPGPAELLEQIDKTGSINRAAGEMNMSYKKAWEIISNLNAIFPKPVVVTQTGGEKGGGSIITAEARRLILYHEQMRKRFQLFLETESKNFSANF